MGTEDRDWAKKRILCILCDVSAGCSFQDEIHFVGSTVDWLRGKKEFYQVGDIDILIDGREVAESFWELASSLLSKGFFSVWDVPEVPKGFVDGWKHCRSEKWHPTALTLDCKGNSKGKWLNLDIQLDDRILPAIPLSSTWMYNDSIPFWNRPSPMNTNSPEPLSFELAIPEVRKKCGM